MQLSRQNILFLQNRVAYLRDEDAYKQLFFYFHIPLYRFALTIVKNGEIADEIVSDTMMKIWSLGNRLAQVDHVGLGGIRPARDAVAFHDIDIRPEPVGDVESASAGYDCPYGKISSRWKKGKHSFLLDVVLPPNTGATIFLPAERGDMITESGRQIVESGGIAFLGFRDCRAIYRVGSGTYSFMVQSGLTTRVAHFPHAIRQAQ